MRFDFIARKQRGAIVASKVTVAVSYNAGSDLYAIEIVHFDGATFDTAILADWSMVGPEAFALVAGAVA